MLKDIQEEFNFSLREDSLDAGVDMINDSIDHNDCVDFDLSSKYIDLFKRDIVTTNGEKILEKIGSQNIANLGLYALKVFFQMHAKMNEEIDAQTVSDLQYTIAYLDDNKKAFLTAFELAAD